MVWPALHSGKNLSAPDRRENTIRYASLEGNHSSSTRRVKMTNGAVHLWREIIKGQDGRRVQGVASYEQGILESAHVFLVL